MMMMMILALALAANEIRGWRVLPTEGGFIRCLDCGVAALAELLSFAVLCWLLLLLLLITSFLYSSLCCCRCQKARSVDCGVIGR